MTARFYEAGIINFLHLKVSLKKLAQGHIANTELNLSSLLFFTPGSRPDFFFFFFFFFNGMRLDGVWY